MQLYSRPAKGEPIDHMQTSSVTLKTLYSFKCEHSPVCMHCITVVMFLSLYVFVLYSDSQRFEHMFSFNEKMGPNCVLFDIVAFVVCCCCWLAESSQT